MFRLIVFQRIFQKSEMTTFARNFIKVLWISPFLMEFGFSKLVCGNQIWKFMCRCRYLGKFSGQFSKISNFLEFGFSDEIKLEFR